MSSIKGKKILITGASRGIGRCLALQLAKKGAEVALVASNQILLDETRHDIELSGGQARVFLCNLTDLHSLKTLIQHILDWTGQLDCLINNAGTSLNKPIQETSNEEWLHCLAVNATAPFILCRDLFPVLCRSDSATIIQIGSVVALKGYINQAAYGASKHALLGMTKVLAQEYQPHGIRVHTINPGGVDTDMVRSMRPDLDTSGLIQPDEIANLVIFLLENRGNAILDDLHIRRSNGTAWY